MTDKRYKRDINPEHEAYCYACLDIVDRRQPHFCIAETVERLEEDGTTSVTDGREIGIRCLHCKGDFKDHLKEEKKE